MRIIVSITLDGWSAGSWYAVETAKRLKARGHDILFVPRPRGRTIEEARIAGLHPVDDVDLEVKGRFVQHVSRLSALWREFRPDTVCAHWGEDHSLWGIVHTVRKADFALVRVRALDPKPPKRHLLARWLHRRTDGIITVNRYLADAYQRHFGFDETTLRVIPGGIDRARFSQAPTFQSSSKPVVGLLARFSPIKGHRDFFAAAKLVASEFPSVVFRCIGFQSELTKVDLQQMAKENGVELQTEVIDKPVDDVVKELEGWTVGVIASQGSESISRALLEYCGCGLPVVATWVGGIPDLLLPQKLGTVVEPHNPSKLAEGICEHLRHPDGARTLGQRARRHVLTECDWERRIDTTEQFLLQVCQSRGSGRK